VDAILRRLLLLATLLFCTNAQAAITRVQAPAGVTNNSTTASKSVTLTSTGAGEAIFVMVYKGDNTGNPTISDNKSNAYVKDAQGTTTENVYIYSCLNPTNGVTSVTITVVTPHIFIAFVATYTGLLSSGAFDKTSYHVTASSTSYSSNATATLSQASELCLGLAATGQSSSDSIVANGSWTNPVAHTGNAGDGDDARWQEQIVNSTSGLAATGTNASVTRLHAIIATYKAAGGVPCPQTRMLLGAGC